jgi:hypothetical protein
MIRRRKPALDLDRGCRDPVNAYSARPTGKSIAGMTKSQLFGVDHFVVTSTRRTEQSRPLIEVQLRSAGENAALLHPSSPNCQVFRIRALFTLNCALLHAGSSGCTKMCGGLKEYGGVCLN